MQQELGKSLSDWSREKFQSLYRGTAFATVIYATDANGVTLFQSLYRGTAFATRNAQCIGILVSAMFQSLYRGTAFATESL